MNRTQRSICFREAYDLRAEGRLSLEDYLKHVVAHYGGLRHETDVEGQQPWLYMGFEYEVRNITLDETYQPLDEDATALLYSIFLAAFKNNFATVQTFLDSSTLAVETYRGPLVEIAKETGDARLLRLCLEQGHDPSGYNESDSMLRCRTKQAASTEWLDVLYNFDFRQWRTEKEQLNDWRTWKYIFDMGLDCVRWWVDHGGHTQSARGLFEGCQPKWPGAPAFQILLDHFGIEWFGNSGTLQLAAQKQDLETVTILVEAGANVNEDVDDWTYDIREHRRAPLSALKEAVYAKPEKMIRYLVDNGARLTRKDIYKPYDQTPEDVKVYKNLVVELGGVKSNDDAGV